MTGRAVWRVVTGAGALAACLLVGSCTEGPVGEPGAPAGAGRTGAGVGDRLPSWRSAPALGVPRDDFGTAVVGDQVWVLGGMTGDRGNRLDSIEVLDTTGGRSWRTAGVRLPEPLAAFEAAAVGRWIYVFGGLDARSRPSDLAARLDTSTGRWETLPSLPTPRYAHTVTLHRGLVHVIGGEGADGPVTRVDVYDPRQGTWSRGAPMPRARGSHDAVSVGDRIYVLGGWEDGGPSDVVQAYQPATGTWARVRALPTPVSRAGVTAARGLVWVSYHQVSFVLDVATGTWHEAPPLRVSRHGLGMAVVGARLYAIGGCSESPLRDVRTVDVLSVTEVSLG